MACAAVTAEIAKLKEWAKSEEGQQSLKTALQSAAESIAELKEARRITPEQLNRWVTI